MNVVLIQNCLQSSLSACVCETGARPYVILVEYLLIYSENALLISPVGKANAS
jgi:hypothetical protein